MSQDGPRPSSRLRFLQFSCKTLLLLTFLAGLAFTWWSDRQEHRQAIRRLENQLTVLQAASAYELWEDDDWDERPPPRVPRRPYPPVPVRVQLAQLFSQVEGWLSENFSENREWKELLSYTPPDEYYQPPPQPPPPYSSPLPVDSTNPQPPKEIPVAKLLPAIRKLLRDGNSQVRLPAVEALVGLEAHTAKLVPDLIAALDDPCPPVRATIAVVLQGLAPASKAALPHLKELLNSSDRIDAVMAAKAIKRIDPQFDVVPRLADLLIPRDRFLALTTADAAAATLWEFGPKQAAGAVPPLYQMVGHKNADVRERAARLLSRLAPREDAIQSLTEALKGEKDPNVKRLIARIVLRLQANGQPAPVRMRASAVFSPELRGAWPSQTTIYR